MPHFFGRIFSVGLCIFHTFFSAENPPETLRSRRPNFFFCKIHSPAEKIRPKNLSTRPKKFKRMYSLFFHEFFHLNLFGETGLNIFTEKVAFCFIWIRISLDLKTKFEIRIKNPIYNFSIIFRIFHHEFFFFFNFLVNFGQFIRYFFRPNLFHCIFLQSVHVHCTRLSLVLFK